MKSNIKTNKVEKNKIILSVGMIVKNEEKHLDNCLSALKKLLDNVPSELIIVDTGSTDKTKEIALKYTDKVYDFEWINDFAAARNYGLEKAVGEWFMFVDADEYLDENCDEMIKFFTMPDVSKKYNSASVIIKNYTANQKKASNQFLASRIVRRYDGLKFNGKIHECLAQPLPHGAFTTFFHHYGYSYETRADLDKKADRNVGPILEEYKNNPKDLRVLAHLCDTTHYDTYFKTYDEKYRYHKEYIEEARKNVNQPYAAVAYYKLIAFYFKFEKFSEGIEITDEFFEVYPDNETVLNLAIYYFRIACFINLKEYEKAYNDLKKYFELYDKYVDGKISSLDLRFCVMSGVTDVSLEQEYMNMANCTNNLGKYDESLEYLNKIDLSDIAFDRLKVFLNIFRDLVRKTQNYEAVAKCYDNILELDDDDKTGMILFLLSQYYLEHPLEREAFANAMVKSKVKGEFIDLMKICKKEQEEKDILNDIQKFINSVTRWNDGYEEAIYLALKSGADMAVPISRMGSKLIREKFEMISEAHYDFAKVVLNYSEQFDYTESIKNMYWMVTAFECAVPISKELSEDDKGEFFDTFVQLLSDYVMNIYNPDLLNPEDVDILPELHRFGYYMTLAFTALNEGEEITYVRMLKEALRLCEPMKDVVSYYLSELEKSMK